MADFLKIINFIIDKNEGRLQYRTGDRGNWHTRTGKINLGTKYGIAGKTMAELYPKLSGEQIKAKVKKLTKEEAIKIYEKKYWTPGRFAKIENDCIAYQFMDHYINGGNGGFGWMVERLNHKYGFFVFRETGNIIHPFAKDGFSDAEIKSINAKDSPQFYHDIQQARIAYYSYKKYEAHKQRPFRWSYEKKKPKQEPFRYNNPFNNWLRYSFGDGFKL